MAEKSGGKNWFNGKIWREKFGGKIWRENLAGKSGGKNLVLAGKFGEEIWRENGSFSGIRFVAPVDVVFLVVFYGIIWFDVVFLPLLLGHVGLLLLVGTVKGEFVKVDITSVANFVLDPDNLTNADYFRDWLVNVDGPVSTALTQASVETSWQYDTNITKENEAATVSLAFDCTEVKLIKDLIMYHNQIRLKCSSHFT